LGLLNFKNLETSFGDIQILDGRETDVLTLQEDKISYVLAGKNLLSDAGAGSALTSVPEVLANQIARVEKYGISFNPESYVQWGYDRFFTDVKRGAVIQMKGDSASQDQLAVVSEANMRTWFRDEFINSFSTQKLGGYDPYMNEYVLSTNDRELPQNETCLECGIAQVFSVSLSEGQGINFIDFCSELGAIVGEVEIAWEVVSIDPIATFIVQANYNGTGYNSPTTNSSGTLSFIKDSITETAAQISVSGFDGNIVISLTVNCPIAEVLTVIEVVVTSDENSSETIHTQYRYIDSPYVGPLQTNSVLFQAGTNPVVSRYNAITGASGSGAIPTEGSTLVIGTNKIVPDTYDFNALGNKFKYLRTNTFYDNTPVDINALLSASLTAAPITGGPTMFQTSFTVPPTIDGNFLYLIWDLRNSAISYLCFTKNGTEEDLQDLCCNCAPCDAECISYTFTNNSIAETADIYLPSGLCGDGREATITLEPREVITLCIVNAEFSIAAGDVSVEFVECGCTGCFESCQEYIVWTSPTQTATINYIDCSTGLPTSQVLGVNESYRACVPIGESIFIPLGEANVDLSSNCGCCPDSTCWTWSVTNPTAGSISFNYIDCSRNPQSLVVLANETTQFCGTADSLPSDRGGKLEFTVINSCGCSL
jgi:hypothetical protein